MAIVDSVFGATFGFVGSEMQERMLGKEESKDMLEEIVE